MKPEPAKPNPSKSPGNARESEETAAEKLSKPPEDKREITIAPTKNSSPDVTLD